MEPGEGDVLWSAIEEHLDEADFFWERFEGALSAADLTLDRVARGVESRLAAHLDGLVSGGTPVVARVLAPGVEGKRLRPSRAGALVLALAEAGRPELALRALHHPKPSVALAARRSLVLAAHALDGWGASMCVNGARPGERVAVLDVAASRGAIVPWLEHSLGSPDPAEVVAALHALHGRVDAPYDRWVVRLLEHPEPAVRDAAMVAALHHGSAYALARCRELALDPNAPHPLAMALLAGLGGPADHERLALLLDSDTHRPAALRALGFSGSAAVVPALIYQLHGSDERAVKLAGEAIATIAGDEVVSANHHRPANDEGTPEDALRPLPREGLDVDTDLVPMAEAPLPTLDGKATASWWTHARSRFDRVRRHLGGVETTRSAFARALQSFPMRRRHIVSLLLSIRSGGALRVATRAFTRIQRAQIAAVCAGDPREPWVCSYGPF